ncbi:FAD-dependent oxidoreductase [Peterkaempfera bronchialis]|uniref:FAD-dependent oxidoreductase n=1 Tax=Peterkaempfera bronchialis TaxID=2126346 RepID=UPI003C2E435E
MAREETACCIVGGGPAGMMLGLLLARAGVRVQVLEKHGDFLRDFRGDTVHASTLTLLDELGLGESFWAIPHRLLAQALLPLSGPRPVTVDLDLLPGPHKHIAMVPQWDLLGLLARAAGQEPTFTLRMATEVTGLLREGDAVTGVRYRTQDGQCGELHATLTVACDGRTSTVRAASGLRHRDFGVPLDVWWFRLPRHPGDPEGLAARAGRGGALVLIDRGEYFQVGYLIRKGSDARMRAEGIEAFRTRLAALLPRMPDRAAAVRSWDEVKLLNVRLDRMQRWFTPGLLCIGDAAHAMSPIGGVGINLAIQDAVATARLLAAPLLAGRVGGRDLARVQLRRWLPTVVTQSLQWVMHQTLVKHGLTGAADAAERDTPPKPALLLQRFRRLRAALAHVIAIGVLPEHAPAFARRPPTPPSRGPEAVGPRATPRP